MPYEPSPTLTDRAKRLFHEGNARHLVIEKDDRRVADLPLTMVILLAIIATWLVVFLAIIALLMGYHVSVENADSLKDEGDAPDIPSEPSAQAEDTAEGSDSQPKESPVEPAAVESHPRRPEVPDPIPTPDIASLVPVARLGDLSPSAEDDDPVAAFEPPPSPEAWKTESRS